MYTCAAKRISNILVRYGVLGSQEVMETLPLYRLPLCFCQILGGGLKSKNTMNINLVGERDLHFNMGFNIKNQVLSCNTLIFTSPLEIVLIVNAARNFLYQAFPSTYKLGAALWDSS